MHMKRSLLALLLAPVALTSCQTAHDAAVSTFRVLDTPNQYIRHKLDVDENDQTTTTPSATTVQQTAPPNDNVYAKPYQQASSPPPQSTTRTTVKTTSPPSPPQPRVVTTERRETALPPTPTPAPRVTTRTTPSKTTQPNESKTTSTTSHATVPENSILPYAKPVPGKPGYVFSPFDPNGGYVDVTGFAPGSKVKDPYSGKIFRVP